MDNDKLNKLINDSKGGFINFCYGLYYLSLGKVFHPEKHKTAKVIFNRLKHYD